jgi:hypothetical protein
MSLSRNRSVPRVVHSALIQEPVPTNRDRTHSDRLESEHFSIIT